VTEVGWQFASACRLSPAAKDRVGQEIGRRRGSRADPAALPCSWHSCPSRTPLDSPRRRAWGVVRCLATPGCKRGLKADSHRLGFAQPLPGLEVPDARSRLGCQGAVGPISW